MFHWDCRRLSLRVERQLNWFGRGAVTLVVEAGGWEKSLIWTLDPVPFLLPFTLDPLEMSFRRARSCRCRCSTRRGPPWFSIFGSEFRSSWGLTLLMVVAGSLHRFFL